VKVVVGLGNPGAKYVNNRHNVGFMVIDKILGEYSSSPHASKKLQAVIYSLDKNRLLVKPQTFMNLSGPAVNRAVNFYKVKPKGLLIVHDDIDLEFGEVKHVFARGAAGHRGVESIIESLGSDKFGRIRVGIGRPPAAVGQIDIEKWVLQNFSENQEEVAKLIERSAEVTINWLREN
jgi:PTH1 family peptidyl-tRNA hydrolase